jgi:phosphoribosyl-dephospho-CoA transferase
MIKNFRAHDLLRINSDGVSALSRIATFSSLPLKDFPFVVVRRIRQTEDLIPVGIRGRERHERCASWINAHHILERIAPESIEPLTPLPPLPAFDALLELKRRWRDMKLAWGPGGSVAFELVSACNVVHDKSDLDLMIRSAIPLSPDLLHALVEVENYLPCAIDMQIETPYGSFAAREYVSASLQCLLRTIDGPRLVANPWLPPSTPEQP